uniref:G-protein coupled receptors family 1 profile domain-containing protein n=1 Tax=Electrophorus electricus TaxID=8005 RepID=A0A4W4DQ01_ELEEL
MKDFIRIGCTLSVVYDAYQPICEKEDVRSFARLFQPVVYGLCLIVGVAGNALVVAVYMNGKRQQTVTDALVVHLAVADLLLLLTLPFWAAASVRGWELGEALCKLVAALYTVNFTCSMLILACISLDRYLALTPAVRNRILGRVFRKEQLSKLGLVVWTTAFLLGVPDLALCTIKHLPGRQVCMAVYPSGVALQVKMAMEIFQVVLSFLAPLATMVYCYTHVVRTLLGLPLESRGRRRWRPVRVLLVVVGAFVLTQLPYNVLKFCRTLDMMHELVTHCGVSKALDMAAHVTESLALSHCCLNPVLYAFIGASFRQHVMKFAKGIGQRRRSAQRGGDQGVNISFNSNSQSQKTSSFSI